MHRLSFVSGKKPFKAYYNGCFSKMQFIFFIPAKLFNAATATCFSLQASRVAGNLITNSYMSQNGGVML